MAEKGRRSGGWRERAQLQLASGVGGGVLTALMRSARWEVEGQEHYEPRRPTVYVLWHGRLLPCGYYHRDTGLAALISQHRDGDYITRVVDRWGYRAVRGSSSRGGGRALRQMVRLLRRGSSVAITPDGPRGPRQVMKIGPLLAARMAGVPIVPLTAGTDDGWWFEGWDRFLVPKPFSRIRLRYGAPVDVPVDATEPQLEQLRQELEDRLDALTAAVDRTGGAT